MKVYISGKIGEEILSEATRQKFAKAESYLRDWGFDVFNPTTSGLGELAERMAKEKGTDFYTEIMELDLEQLRGVMPFICLLTGRTAREQLGSIQRQIVYRLQFGMNQ